MTEQNSHIIIDNGTGFIKAGLSGEKSPKIIFPTCVGYPKYGGGRISLKKKEFYVGYEAESIQGVLKTNNPIEQGVVNNWDDMEKIWGYTFTDKLKLNQSEYNIMTTETPMNPKENKEKMTQIMFEAFNVKGLYIANESILSLYSVGKCTGISVDSGNGITNFSPIFEGCILPHAVFRTNLAGKNLTEYLIKILSDKNVKFSTSADKEIIKTIKEKVCYVSLDFEKEINSVESYNYELPDGSNIALKEERIQCPEALFKPYLIGKQGDGIGKMCFNSMNKCNSDIQKEIFRNIILSGGNTMFNGLRERFENEVKNLFNNNMKDEVKVISPPEQRNAVWIGGSLLSNSSFDSKWITKTEYQEYGVLIVHRKCF
jgi:actin-related protein